MNYILAINPGSTSTKVALWDSKKDLLMKTISHPVEEIQAFENIMAQYNYRINHIMDWLVHENISLDHISAVVGRGGLLRSIPGGTYIVSDQMLKDLRQGIQGEHASNLGAFLAKGIADIKGIPAYIVDPVSVDEFEKLSRISGLKEISRVSLLHALNIKATCHRLAKETSKRIEELNLVVGHLGGGISVAAIKNGKAIDVNNSIQMGPFSPERSGSLPVGDLVELCYLGKYSYKQMHSIVQGKGGLMSYLATKDAREIVNRINNGDKYAKLIFDAMAYQIGKEIGSYATVLSGKVDNIILTGGLAYSDYLINKIIEAVNFIAPVVVYPGENEMDALIKGALRVINGLEKPKIYEDEVV